ncbi:hypothetical protein PybrP1_001231 [[Pythium] brassicae (nom. inval.)]|nr:hypothetical protein PybrP1_001231 [[Pythium] brassicae (nom. inval.)]
MRPSRWFSTLLLVPHLQKRADVVLVDFRESDGAFSDVVRRPVAVQHIRQHVQVQPAALVESPQSVRVVQVLARLLHLEHAQRLELALQCLGACYFAVLPEYRRLPRREDPVVWRREQVRGVEFEKVGAATRPVFLPVVRGRAVAVGDVVELCEKRVALRPRMGDR